MMETKPFVFLDPRASHPGPIRKDIIREDRGRGMQRGETVRKRG